MASEGLTIKRFQTAEQLADWVNNNIRTGDIISIVKDSTYGMWVLFYSK